MKARLTQKEVAARLNVGPRAVYALLERGVLPGIRLGKRWLITRHAYEEWERTCGMRPHSDVVGTTGLSARPEVLIN
jgi:excisionase family DNA binding protein